MADFEALKDQWSDVEDRDGVRLSWNTFPSSRMVWPASSVDITGC
jgi:protein transport protein SEC23